MLFSKFKLIIILIIIGLVAYLPSLNNKFVWDDEQFIYNNSYVKDFEIKKIFTENTTAGAGETSTYYRPLTTLSFATDHQIWGLNPVGFHLTNTFLHLSAGIILFFFLLNLGISKNKSFWITAIFLSHPLQTEAVVYANSRGDSMYVFWSLLGLLAFSFLSIKKYPKFKIYDLEINFNKLTLSILTLIFYLLSILGKEIGIASLGLFFITFGFINLQNLLTNNKKILLFIKKKYLEIVTLLSLFLTAILYLIFRSQVLNISSSTNFYGAESAYGGNIFVRLHTFTKALWTYFQLIFYPYPLHMERSLEIIIQPISIWLIATIILSIFIFITGLIEYKKRKTSYTWFGSLWFIIMLVPVSGILPINGLIYEHWLYMPIIGFAIMLMGMISVLFKNKLNLFIKYLLPILLIIYVALTIRQNYIWGDPIRFYNYTLSFGKSIRLTNNLAMSYAEIGENQKAIDIYQQAIEMGDFYPQTHHNLGNVYLATNQLQLAENSFRTAIGMNNSFYPSYNKLINILLQKENYQEALPLLNELENKNPTNFEVGIIYADTLYKVGDKIQAEKQILNLKALFGNNQRAMILINQTVKNNTQ